MIRYAHSPHPPHVNVQVFWAARGSSLIPTNIVCSNSDAARFTFWRSWTTDFANFTKPAMFFGEGGLRLKSS